MKEKLSFKLITRIAKISFLIVLLLMVSGFISGCAEKLAPLPEQPQPQPTAVIEIAPESQAGNGNLEVFRDLAYGSLSPAQTLDLYVPEGKGPFPLVVIIHGGGFMTGDKTNGAELGRVKVLLKEGYAVASINYRLSDEAIYPAQIHDVKAAVRYLRANAQKYRLDPDNFGAWGSSAGGTLAALLGTTCDVTELEGAKLGNSEQSSCLQAVVDWFGLVDLLKMDKQFKGTGCPGGHDEADSAESLGVGAPIQTVPEIVYKTNPTNYIDASDPPFFIQHGSDDCRVPPEQSKDLAEALRAVIGGENVYYSVLPGAVHGGAKFKTDANFDLVIDFLDSYLK